VLDGLGQGTRRTREAREGGERWIRVHVGEELLRGADRVGDLEELVGIERATIVLFWMPFRITADTDPASLPGFTTRAEVSRELQRAPERLVLGMPADAFSSGHIRYHAHHAGLHEPLALDFLVEKLSRDEVYFDHAVRPSPCSI